MSQAAQDLYARYLRAMHYFNSLAVENRTRKQAPAAIPLKVLSEKEFAGWWQRVSDDKELQARWLERFDDPEGSVKRACKRIENELDQIPVRRVAA